MRQELARLKAALEAGSASDNLVQRKLDELLPSLEQLRRLDAVIPKSATASSGSDLRPLRDALASLDSLLRERHTLVAAIKARMRAETAASAAAQLGDLSVSDDTVFGQLFARQHAHDETALSENIARQQQLLDTVSTLASQVLSSRAQPDARAAACQSLSKMCVAFNELLENEKEGINFYADLQGSKKKKKSNVNFFLFQRSAGQGAPRCTRLCVRSWNRAKRQVSRRIQGHPTTSSLQCSSVHFTTSSSLCTCDCFSASPELQSSIWI